jgi:hypothetical protein
MRVRRRVAPLASLAVLALVLAACGKEDDFDNEPRPATPLNVTASVKEREVTVSPSEVGAGLVVFTVANESSDPARFTLDGPVDGASDEIPPGGTGTLKSSLEEGSYEVTAGEGSKARGDRLKVGPPRPTAQNDVLLP